MKLGKRLSQIESMVTSEYTHIWDCCCDHGFLGANLLAENKAPTIHFVDIVPSLMASLETKLKRYFPNQQFTDMNAEEDAKSKWQIHCMNVADLPIAQHSGKQLVIIAGVGGDLTIQLIRDIQQANPECELDFLLCPVHQQYLVRQGLQQLDFHLQTECLVEENRRYYEVILASNPATSTGNHKAITTVGCQIWNVNSEQEHVVATRYLKNTLAHYQRMQRSNDEQVEAILRAYQQVSIEMR
ncbi:SAM-dependent methyltransferase [Vibrio sp. T187]|uniref:tRNA (adenine(22)-N(1))-methyltransferase n=1 Tax=Vibrio TaxID=662 RepID=UPI0010C9C427|nr:MULTISPECIES: tRNA (adenine(22)-N(1))-methyltransferase TrmK [Vibrio]MBW3695395.1 SAM-dependent methyltransferase [Vibrio sp. T187]